MFDPEPRATRPFEGVVFLCLQVPLQFPRLDPGVSVGAFGGTSVPGGLGELHTDRSASAVAPLAPPAFVPWLMAGINQQRSSLAYRIRVGRAAHSS
jgi:hypothetical protein